MKFYQAIERAIPYTLVLISDRDTLAMIPAPVPTIISPFGRSPRVVIPREYGFFTGPTLL